jgi:hypothetical protein
MTVVYFRSNSVAESERSQCLYVFYLDTLKKQAMIIRKYLIVNNFKDSSQTDSYALGLRRDHAVFLSFAHKIIHFDRTYRDLSPSLSASCNDASYNSTATIEISQ